MDTILQSVIDKFALVYLDDTINILETFAEDINHLNEVFILLKNAGLTEKIEK